MGVLDLNKSTAGISHTVNYSHQSLHNHLTGLIQRQFPNGCRALDVGCGTGSLVASLLKLGFDAHGTDALARGELAEQLIEAGRLRLGDFFEYENKDGQFDLVILAEVLEHIEDYVGFISKAADLLSADGTLVVSVPNFWTAQFTCCPSCNCIFPPSGHIWKFKPEWLEADVGQFFSQCNVSTYFNPTWTRFPLRYIAHWPKLNAAMNPFFSRISGYTDRWTIAVASRKLDSVEAPCPHAQPFVETDEYLRIAKLY